MRTRTSTSDGQIGRQTGWQKNLLLLALSAACAGAFAEGKIEGSITGRAGTGGAAGGDQGIAVQGVKVRLKELNRETLSQRDGSFVFLDVKAGRYTLVTSYLGADVIERSLQVEDGKTQKLQLQLTGADTTTEHLLVIGQAAGMNKALNSQRSADNIITKVSADAIGQFPDTNVSEALQRLPGLSVERDQGEGRYVRVRGMGPDFNAVTINGVGVPAPDADRRAVALDVIPSDLLESLVVTKSLTPDMDANSLGGSIDVQSLSAFDRDGFFYQLSAEASSDENTGETSPKLSLTGSNRFSLGDGTDNVGVAAGLSYFKRKFGSDNVETGGDWNFDSDAPLLEKLEERDYRIARKRSGLVLNLDYKPSDNTSLYWRNLYSEYTDAETRLANVIEFGDGAEQGVEAEVEVARKLKQRTETQKIFSSSLGGKTHFDRWTLDYSLAFSKSGEDEPLHIGSAAFEVDGAVIADETFNLSYTGSDKIRVSAPAEFYQAQSYLLKKVELASNNTNDQSKTVKLDLTRDFDWGNNPAQIKMGLKRSERDKDNDTQEFVQKKNFIGDTSLSAFVDGDVDYALGDFGPHINKGLVLAAAGDVKIDDEASSINDFDVSEDSNAAYVMGRVDIGDWRMLTGVRYESTDFSAGGFAYDADAETITPQHFVNRRDYFLPALHIRYAINDNTQVRAAWTNSVVRPSFGQLSPGRLTEVNGDDIDTEFGNPDLKPLEAQNFDLGIEHYYGVAGVLSAFVFYKDIENFAYQADLAGTAGYEDFHHAQTWVNGASAKLLGLELAASKQFSSLPAPWSGLLLGANATWVDSSAEIGDYDRGEFVARDIPMPSQSDVAANLMLGYEGDKLSLRLSANYKSEYLLEVLEPMDARYDNTVDSQVFVDFTFNYFISDRLKLTFEALNLTDEVYYTYVNSPRYNAQYEQYGSTYKLGLTFMSF